MSMNRPRKGDTIISGKGVAYIVEDNYLDYAIARNTEKPNRKPRQFNYLSLECIDYDDGIYAEMK